MAILNPAAQAASAFLVSAHKHVVEEQDRQIKALQAEKDELQRALQAKTAEASRARKQAYRAFDDVIYAYESRALTSDAITDEMVDRAKRELFDTEGLYVSRPSMRDVLAAALTAPPKRPEGAEDIEALIREHVKANPGTDDASIADWLAERGVRVVAEEMNR